jgi:hypothetical protein
MILSVHQPQYLPWLGFFDKIRQSDCFVYLDQVQYKEREYQNRNRVRTKEGWMWLTVPVKSTGLGRQRIRDVEVDNSSDWAKKHLASLEKCYNRAPFFKEHRQFLEEVYSAQWEKLVDLNIKITGYLLEQFEITTPVKLESNIGTTSLSTERIIELCLALKADTYLSGTGGKDYLEEEKFKQAGISLRYQHFDHPRYHQVYAAMQDEFVPNMAAVDLLFNEGENSRRILKGES